MLLLLYSTKTQNSGNTISNSNYHNIPPESCQTIFGVTSDESACIKASLRCSDPASVLTLATLELVKTDKLFSLQAFSSQVKVLLIF